MDHVVLAFALAIVPRPWSKAFVSSFEATFLALALEAAFLSFAFTFSFSF